MREQQLTPNAAIDRWDDTFDVLVGSSGCAGLGAAIEAARSGARTLALERASGVGGTSALSGGVIYCGGGTAVQNVCGFEDSAEAMRRYLMGASDFGPDEARIDRYCSGSVAHLDWLASLGRAAQAELLAAQL